jgi:LmbE family N-acetylglucosaminyl deacetylase
VTCLLLVVAHPDDETFGCGSLLLHAGSRGARTVVVCATRGEAGEVTERVTVPAGGLGAVREAELRAAAAYLGVADVELLDLADSGMAGEAGPETLVGAPLDDVVARVRGAVDRHRPDVVVTLDGGDGHRDHVRIREAVEAAVRGTEIPLYAAGLPRSLMHAWVRHHQGRDYAEYTELPDIGTPDDQFTTVVDTAAYLDRRDTAIGLHASQKSPFDGLPDDLHRGFLTREHLIRLNPPWDGGPVESELLGL